MKKTSEKIKNKNRLTSKFYGKSSYVKMIDSYYSNKEIRSYRSFFIKEKKTFFNKLNLNKKLIALDVGTGRQSIALSKYFSHVDHFDITKKHVLLLRNYIKKNKIKNISSYNADLDSFKLKKKYDFINLDGILMHTNNPTNFLMNIMSSLKDEGIIKLLIYKSGSLKFILINFLRDIIKITNIKIESPFKNKVTNMLFEDDLYVPILNLFDESKLYSALNTLSGSSNKDIKLKNFAINKKIDTKKFHHSLSFFVTKKANKSHPVISKLKVQPQIVPGFLKEEFSFYKSVGEKLISIIKILKNKKIDKNKELDFKVSILRIYKISQYKFFYRDLTYESLITLLNNELFNINRILLKNHYD